MRNERNDSPRWHLVVPLLRAVVDTARTDRGKALDDALANLDAAEEENRRYRMLALETAPKCAGCGERFLGPPGEAFCSIGCRL